MCGSLLPQLVDPNIMSFAHHGYKIDFFVDAWRGKRVRVHRTRSPWFATGAEAVACFNAEFDGLWDEVHSEWPEVLATWRFRIRWRSWPAPGRVD